MDLTLSSDDEHADVEQPLCEMCPPRSDDDLAWGEDPEPLIPLSCGHKLCGSCLRTHVQKCVMARRVIDLKCPSPHGCLATLEQSVLKTILDEYWIGRLEEVQLECCLAENTDMASWGTREATWSCGSQANVTQNSDSSLPLTAQPLATITRLHVPTRTAKT